MAPDGKRPMPLSLAFVAKSPLKGSPRAYEPLSSHRVSMASTGEGEGHSPFFRSPEVTYRPLGSARSKADGATQGLPPSSPRAPPGQASSQHTPRRAYRVAGSEPVLGPLLSPDLIHVKEHGYGLPPLKEQLIDMLHEETTPHTRRLVEQIPKYQMLKLTGASVYSHDPMFTEDIFQYQLDHPIPPYVLQKFPNYMNFPLLLNVLKHPDIEPNITEVEGVKHLRGHNEKLLENKYKKKHITQNISLREGYMYVPNFGRVQVVLTDYPDGKSYPLVTLPKMTPYDILNVLERMQKARRRSWFNYCKDLIRYLSCGML